MGTNEKNMKSINRNKSITCSRYGLLMCCIVAHNSESTLVHSLRTSLLPISSSRARYGFGTDRRSAAIFAPAPAALSETRTTLSMFDHQRIIRSPNRNHKSTQLNLFFNKNNNKKNEEEDETMEESKKANLVTKLYDRLLSMLPPAVAKTVVSTITRMYDFLPTLRTISLSFFAGTILALSVILIPVFTDKDGLTEPVTLFETILSDLNEGYVENVDTQKLFETGVSAMLKSLDPYTEFEGRQEAVDMQESVLGKYGGVGLVISGKPNAATLINANPNNDATDGNDNVDVMNEEGEDVVDGGGMLINQLDSGDSGKVQGNVLQKMRNTQKKDADGDSNASKKKNKKKDDGIRVVSAFEGYAFDAGMRVGDRLLSIDDYQITDETSVEDVRNKLRGEPGTSTTVSFLRDGIDGIQTVVIPRSIVKIPNVKCVAMVGQQMAPSTSDSNIGYIQLGGFTQDAGREMRAGILALQRKAELDSDGTTGLKGLIIDLRDNPGGLLTSAVDVASLLVPKDSDIVSARGRGFPNVLYRSRVEPLVDPSTKVVMLVSGNTASAAEILSGAVQDLDVGVILGSERTYGKGLVQNVEQLPFDTALKFTVAKYYTPSGRCIQSTNYKEGGGLNNDAKFIATKIADKDKSEFFTKGGRKVQDGGGIEADVKVDPPKGSALEVTLIRNNLLTQYAAEWSKNHQLTNGFKVTDDVYTDFQNFVTKKQQDKETDLLQGIYGSPLASLKKSLKQSGYTHSMNQQLEQLQSSILHEMKQDFIKYKKDIKEDLEQAILARYLPESMLIERSIRTDVQVKEAVKLIANDSKFNSILARAEQPSGRITGGGSVYGLSAGNNRNNNGDLFKMSQGGKKMEKTATGSFGEMARETEEDLAVRLNLNW
mmetsp:Transcript_30966/g.45799  ORF Transcript_30966/g.45799 Transcript_30966/m.45799 type:complete len:884 (-) Transcript_30966:200-2851(-)